MTTRRSFLLRWTPRAVLLCAALRFGLFSRPAAADNARADPVRIGLTPVFLDDQVAFLNVWREYLQRRLGRTVVFVQRGSYREIVEMLRQDKLDFAWVCGYPYARNRKQMRLLAVPVFNGRPLYQSYLIVPAGDQNTRSFLDLKGKVFAYSDPDSNSGYLYPQFALLQIKEQPSAFFARTFFTWAHRKVIEAVGSGLAQGGAVDGYVWETLRLYHPEITGRTRVVQKSPDFGHPPFVARGSISGGDFAALQKVLLEMDRDERGVALLKKLNLDRFTAGEDALFDSIGQMSRTVNGARDAAPS